jgi:putative transposase
MLCRYRHNIHLIRSCLRYVAWEDRKKITAALRPVYTAVNEAAARAAPDQLRAGFGKKASGVIAVWERAWEQFIPFLEFDTAIRKVIYTTDENVNPRPGGGPGQAGQADGWTAAAA